MLDVLLVDDYAIFRSGMKMLLETDENIHVVGEATNEIEVLHMLESKIPADIILTEFKMPEMDGMNLISKIKKYDSNAKVIVFSMFNSLQHVFDAFSSGAAGYLLKECDIDELFFAIKKISNGGKYLCSELTVKLLDNFSSNPDFKNLDRFSRLKFSKRELEILKLIGEGMTNFEMSERLFLSKRTVEGHRQHLIDKTGSRNTAMLMKYAILNRMIS